VNPQNSELETVGPPRTEAHPTVAITAANANMSRISILRPQVIVALTLHKLADSTSSVRQSARMHLYRHPTLIFALALAAACSGRDKSSAQAVGDTVGAARRAQVVIPSSIAYREVEISNAGKVTGTVRFTGTPATDTLIQIPADQNGCGKPLILNFLSRSNGNLAGAVVWLTDVRQGEALPLNRRFQLTNNDCAWDPQVQVVVAGGTLNVVNYDPLAERAFVTEVSSGDTLALAPFTDDGQVIPYDKLLRTPHVLEFSVESRPMSRAWVVVLDQPYFATTDSKGNFTIEGVPPGLHHIRVWHPMLGTADGTVTVTSNGTATVDLAFH
jgi:hypothetical protein